MHLSYTEIFFCQNRCHVLRLSAVSCMLVFLPVKEATAQVICKLPRDSEQ